MSILIRGFSKKDFDELVQYARYGANNCMIGENTEVIEIPPHGDLIDKDAMLNEACSDCEPLSCDHNCTLVELIKDAPAVIEAESPESCGDCNHYCTGQFFNNEEICMVTGDNAPYDISDCPLRKKEEGRE